MAMAVAQADWCSTSWTSKSSGASASVSGLRRAAFVTVRMPSRRERSSPNSQGRVSSRRSVPVPARGSAWRPPPDF